MVTHFIIMSSSYSIGKRIALSHMVNEEDYLELKEIVQDIVKRCGKDVSISTHFIQTDSETWQSVVEKDHFFKGVKVIENKEQFIELIQRDRILTGLDIARYILSKIKCTHLKLEKLVYLCFADYLCKTNKELYIDKIYAYKYGPVVDTVYEKYKGFGSKEIESEDVDIKATEIKELPSRSRILFAKDGVEKIMSIDETLKKCGNLSAAQLVELTHKKSTPWDIAGRGNEQYAVIDNEIIKKYHYNETF